MNKELIAYIDEDKQETGKLPESTLARKMTVVFATAAALFQMSMQKTHHYQKILAPAKKTKKWTEIHSISLTTNETELEWTKI